MSRIFELSRPWRAGLATAVVLGSGLISYATVLNPYAPAAALVLLSAAILVQVSLVNTPLRSGGYLVFAGLFACLAAAIDPLTISPDGLSARYWKSGIASPRRRHAQGFRRGGHAGARLGDGVLHHRRHAGALRRRVELRRIDAGPDEVAEPAMKAGRRLLVVDKPERTQTQILVGTLGMSAHDEDHAPLVIAEQFATLEALHPGRIDLGLGRAPGTAPRRKAHARS